MTSKEKDEEERTGHSAASTRRQESQGVSLHRPVPPGLRGCPKTTPRDTPSPLVGEIAERETPASNS